MQTELQTSLTPEFPLVSGTPLSPVQDGCTRSNQPSNQLKEHRERMRQQFDHFTPKIPDPCVQRDLTHGWLLPALLRLDEWLWQRWDYWFGCCQVAGQLPDAPIPPIQFLGTPHPATRKMVEASLNCIPNHGSWQTWGNWQYVSYLFDWLLFGFGHPGHPQLPPEPTGCQGASHRLYQVFMLDALLLWPHDYWGQLLGENSYGRGQGFYATPHTICEMMTQMVFDSGKDQRRETMIDPCVGTGRFPLHASNHTLRLYGMDIDATLCKATLVNGYLYAPWLVKPIPWLDPVLAQLSSDATSPADSQSPLNGVAQFSDAQDLVAQDAARQAAELSQRMTESAPPYAQSYLADTEYDEQEQTRVAPLLKRRKRKSPTDPTQGSLF